MRSLILIASSLLLVACAGARVRLTDPGQSAPTELSQGSVEAPPSLQALPDLDVPEEEVSERMRFAMSMAEEALEIPTPPPPEDRSLQSISAWMEGVIGPWIAQKSHSVSSARDVLMSSSRESGRERTLATAIIALMYEDLVRSLRTMPMPADLEAEPEVAQLYRDVVFANLTPYVREALRFYRDGCMANADRGPEGMQHWRSYCARRSNALEDEVAPRGLVANGPAAAPQ